MILELPAILRTALPALPLGEARLSVVEIHTTRPLFMVFGDDSSRPLFVVQFGREKTLRGLHETLIRLQATMPGVVPRSLAFCSWRGGMWMHVQEGLPGHPWFCLAARFDSLGGWESLRRRALTTLRCFQQAVRTEPDFLRVTAVGAELRQQSALCLRNGYSLQVDTLGRIEAAARVLDKIGSAVYPWQHGDYCLNNMLVTESSVGLIDFEEFGGTSVPLHDEFSLAFSFHEFAEKIRPRPALADHISFCCREALSAAGLRAESAVGLLFHHLLWRLNQCAERPRRQAVAELLQHHLRVLTERPEEYLPPEGKSIRD